MLKQVQDDACKAISLHMRNDIYFAETPPSPRVTH